MSDRRSLLIAVDLDGDGAHPAAWRHAGRPPAQALTPAALRATVRAAEAAGFTLATFADAPVPPSRGPDAAGRLEAGIRAAFAAPLTDRIGLAPTLHVTTTEPFHLATQLASLDHAGRGRAGWVVGAAHGAGDLATIGADPLTADAARREAEDVVDVARLLWDSWQDDAVIRDVATGRYLDPGRVHHVNFTGSTFTVTGPLITPRPPQGQVVVLAPAELEIDARADVVLVGDPDPGALARRADQARNSGAALAFAEVEVVLDAEETGARRLAALDAATPWPDAGRLRYAGPASGLVDLLRSLAPDVDGVRLHPAVLAADLPVLAGQVLPALAAAGLHRAPEPGATLRATLGLPRPANRFAAPATTTA
ncbi:monooxygenase [Sphaerisporangium krabiense]|uniref:Alkanesulfonate monooxygenase SsuD/methylene tetrahydromethanopterin reductase-like flavin-dependent oxidoreductase (Luciferase family) n=1 Tax=Sphaerisporangium krabiense TaxID=763782 RepID=A0A7W8Z0Q8_9ACTN|nr:LLM class flavin-dependent oxidoreductase [Sphaerisporangium krabiense]MBB5625250.1 alkanesulfonate monooxygenase SsuD/methylene tetrahydromethanopterin reductase-like flavin-dependent oxidoreductase (luciferase family) [Sphaerisporangium krabiense]GII64238.1 monooxygenase [Sphaerisporangium krabiense]